VTRLAVNVPSEDEIPNFNFRFWSRAKDDAHFLVGSNHSPVAQGIQRSKTQQCSLWETEVIFVGIVDHPLKAHFLPHA